MVPCFSAKIAMVAYVVGFRVTIDRITDTASRENISFSNSIFPMKKILALLTLCSIGLIIGISYSYWQNATAVPDWYTESEPAPQQSALTSAVPTPAVRPASAIQEKIQIAQPGIIQEQLTSAEIDNLIVAGLTKSNNGSKPLPKAIKSIKTKIQQDQIRTGAIVDLAAIEQMPPSPRTEMIHKLLKVMPQLRDRPVYLGVVGQLTVKNGQPQLAPDSKLQIGKVELPLDDVAQRIGISRAALEQNLTSYLQFQNLNIDKVDLTDRGLMITGQKK
jgi:hypothetical protein